MLWCKVCIAFNVLLGIVFLSITPVSAEKLSFVTQEFYPFSYVENGKPAGPAVKVVAEICNVAGLESSVTLYPWRRAQSLVRRGTHGAMFLVGRNADRDKWLHFSLPLFHTAYGFFVRTDSPLSNATGNDFKGETMCVHGPSNTSHTLEKIDRESGGGMDIRLEPMIDQVFLKLAYKRVPVAFANRDVGNAVIKRLGLTGLRYVGDHLALDYHVGFSKRQVKKEIVDAFNAAILSLYSQGKLSRLIEEESLEPAKIIE